MSRSALAALAALVIGFGFGWLFARLVDGGERPARAVVTVEPSSEASVEAQAKAGAPARRPPASAQQRRPRPSSVARSAEPELESGSSELFGSLEAAWRAGRLGNDEALLAWIVRGHLEAHDPRAAFALLERQAARSAALYRETAAEFLAQGDRVRALASFLRALDLDPGDREALHALVRLAPDEALTRLPALAQADVFGRKAWADLANELARQGQTQEALGLANQILAADPNDDSALALLGKLDPQGAEALLRARLAAGEDDVRTTGQLANLLEREARGPEAARLIVDVLERSSATEADVGLLPWSLIGASVTDAHDWFLEAYPLDQVDPAGMQLWGLTGDAFLEAGDLEGALDAWERAVLVAPSDPSEWIASLREHAPERLVGLLERRVRAQADAESRGLLGDALWNAQRQREALEAWSSARRLDPEDGRWQERLDAVAAGRSPLE